MPKENVKKSSKREENVKKSIKREENVKDSLFNLIYIIGS